MDKRKTYYMVLDTETANCYNDEQGKLDTRNALVYDIGWIIMDKKGKVYTRESFVVYEIFFGMKDLMESAYYANKIPQYLADIQEGKRIVKRWANIKKILHDQCRYYNVKAIIAHNARFDDNAVKQTQRYLTASFNRYFFPYGIEVWDTLKMSHDIILKQKGYKTFCEQNNYFTKNHQMRATAEILYRWLSGDNDFAESHTGLEDVEIESQIFLHCLKQHKPMRKKLWEN